MTTDTDQDFKELETYEIPARRAAYSDRTAWLMAVMAQLAYIPLDEESPDQILALAEELAGLTNAAAVADRLKELQKVLAGLNPPRPDGAEDNPVLRAALKAGGFELLGVLHDAATDTQGYVAHKPPAPNNPAPNNTAQDFTASMGMLVLAFRGTKQVKDWMTNLDIRPIPVRLHGKGAIRGNLHKGFHDAYMSVHDKVRRYLDLATYPDVPVYITGHSLGGALAVTATWFQPCRFLAACYTFGAPRVCDQALMDEFKTPIYRTVNGPDPVPFVPPAGWVITTLKSILRVISTVTPGLGIFKKATDRLVKQQRFRHAGNMRYLTPCDRGPTGDYPDLSLEYAVSSWRRFWRFLKLKWNGQADGLVKYHDMALYKDKLAAFARRRNEP